MLIINLVLGQAAFLATGYLLYTLVLPPRSLPRTMILGISYGTGLGCQMFLLFLIALWGRIPADWATVSVAVLVPLALLRYHRRRSALPSVGDRADRPVTDRLGLRLLWAALISYTLFQVLAVWGFTCAWPMYEYDALWRIAPKAKVLFYEGSLANFRYMELPGYPVLVPLAMAWSASVMGAWVDPAVKIFQPCLFVAMLAMLYGFIVERTKNRLTAAATITALAASNFLVYHASLAYADFTTAYFLLGTVLVLAVALDRPECPRLLTLSGALLAALVLTKKEGLLYAVIVTAVFFLHTRREKWTVSRACRLLLPALAALGALLFFRRSVGAPLLGDATEVLLDWPHLFSNFTWKMLLILPNEFLISGNWGLTWAVLALLWLARPKGLAPDAVFIKKTLVTLGWLCVVGLTVLSCLGAICVTPTALDAALSRTVLHIYPLAAALLGLLIHHI